MEGKMRLDGLTLNELAKEIDLRCKGLRVEKVTSAGRHAVVLGMQRGNDLLVSSSPNGARAVLTTAKTGTRAESVGFVMVLRKYIEGGRFLRASKRSQENAIELWLQGWDDDEGIKPKLLLLEAVGPKSNIFFLDENNTILGSLKGTDDRRAGAPGQIFEPLPPFDMPDALSCTKDAFIASALRRRAEKGDIGPAKAIAGGLYGLSVEHAADLIAASGNRLADISAAAESAYLLLRRRQEEFGPDVWPCCEASDEKGPRASLILCARGAGSGPSECVEGILGRLEKDDQVSQRKTKLLKTVDSALSRAVGKSHARRTELASSKKSDTYRIWADAILSSMHELPKMLPATATLPDYSADGDKLIEVPLDARFGASQNAERYYQMYNRGRRAEKALAELISSSDAECEYLAGVKDACERAEDEIVLDQIREELEMAGYLKREGGKPGKKQDKKAAQPVQYPLSTGHKALVGRNNVQNEELTFKIANPWDIWLHIKGAPGSHVVIRLDKGEKVPEAALEQAANLAVMSSSLKGKGRAEVDYTEVRKVKKIKGGLPGAVTYTDQRTINVKP